MALEINARCHARAARRRRRLWTSLHLHLNMRAIRLAFQVESRSSGERVPEAAGGLPQWEVSDSSAHRVVPAAGVGPPSYRGHLTGFPERRQYASGWARQSRLAGSDIPVALRGGAGICAISCPACRTFG